MGEPTKVIPQSHAPFVKFSKSLPYLTRISAHSETGGAGVHIIASPEDDHAVTVFIARRHAAMMGQPRRPSGCVVIEELKDLLLSA